MMDIETISNHDAQEQLGNGSLVIIDVREPAEYREDHIPGSINFPSSDYRKDRFTGFQNMEIALVCQSGNRSKNIGIKLKKDGFQNVFLLDLQMNQESGDSKTTGWTIDRQFRFTLGVLLLIFLLLNPIADYAIVLPTILCCGLIVTALIDNCYMRSGIAMLPWNKGKK